MALRRFWELEWQKAIDTPLLFEHPVIVAIAKKHNKSPAQVILRWATQRGLAVIPKSNSLQRLEQNLHVTDFDLEESELEAVCALDRNLRFNNPTDVCCPVILVVSSADRLLVPRNSSYLRLGTAPLQGAPIFISLLIKYYSPRGEQLRLESCR